MTESLKSERERLRSEYARRDASNWLSQTYSYLNPAFQYHLQEREWELLKILRKIHFSIAGSQVLEVGCGNGHILNRFLEFGCASAYGVDLMANRILDGTQRYPHLHLGIADATHLPFAEKTFDLVSQFMCISSILDHAMRSKIALEMWRVLRPNGILLCYDLRPATLTRRLISKLLVLKRQYWRHPLSSPTDCPPLGGETCQDHPTPIVPLTLDEIESWWGYRIIEKKTASLDFDYARLAEHSRTATEILGLIKSLHTHHLVVARKPSPLGQK
jgi:ubiquinone/menaquinone biosynthesis C-methylase UbiE